MSCIIILTPFKDLLYCPHTTSLLVPCSMFIDKAAEAVPSGGNNELEHFSVAIEIYSCFLVFKLSISILEGESKNSLVHVKWWRGRGDEMKE